MGILLRNVSFVFAAGCFGGLANSLAVWFFGETGITAALGVHLAPALTARWLYPRLVWGGLWGALFLFPFLRYSIILRGFVYSLGPTFVQLFIVFPRAGKGAMGLELGALTPLFVLFFNALWGVAAGYWLRHAR